MSLCSLSGQGFGGPVCGGWYRPECGLRRPFDRKNIPGYLTTPTSENRVGKWRTQARGFAKLPEGGDESNGNDNHGNPAGRRGLPKAVREPPRVHDAVHAAATRNRAALLLPAKQEGDGHAP